MASALAGKTWEELEALEFTGRLYFPDTVKRRSKSGAVDEIEICLRVPNKAEKLEARLEAIAWAKERSIDRTTDADVFEEMENVCLLARSIRERKEPHEQHQLSRWLFENYESSSLADLWDRLNTYETMLDPRIGEMTEEQFWETVLAIGRTRTLRPLTGLAPRAQRDFLLSLAEQALLSPTLKLFLESRVSLTQGA